VDGSRRLGWGCRVRQAGQPAGAGRCCRLASCQSARSMAYQATTVPAIGSSPWKRRPHLSITRREAALAAMVTLMIRASPTVSKP